MKVVIDKDFEEIVPGFIANREKDLVQLQAFLAEANFKEIESLAHKISGSAGSYGFDGLGELAHELEKVAQEQNETTVKLLIAKYEDYLSSLEIEYD